MNRDPEWKESDPSPEQIEAALDELHRGSPEAFDRLITADEVGSSGVCDLFLDLITSANQNSTAPPSIAGYRIGKLLGAGGMGVVFQAQQTSTRRDVAIKVIRSHIGDSGPTDRLFRREVDTLVRLRNPNIAALYDAGSTEDGSRYFAMEFVDGKTFRDYMRDVGGADLQKESGRRALEQFVEICKAMNHAHQRGVIHCDLKPTNIMIATDETPKVLDFGLSRLIDPDISTIPTPTASNHLIGTLAYMSPEQARGAIDEIDIRSDVYSLGVILYELLCGQPPYQINSRAIPAGIKTICETGPRRPSSIRPTLKGDLDAIAMKALEKDPARRYQTAGELADDIDRGLRGEPVEARSDRFFLLRRTLYRYRIQTAVAAAFALVLVSATAVSGWFWYQAEGSAKRAEAELKNATEAGSIALTLISEFMREFQYLPENLRSHEEFNKRLIHKLNRLDSVVPRTERFDLVNGILKESRADLLQNTGSNSEARDLFKEIIDDASTTKEQEARIYRKLGRLAGRVNSDEYFKKALSMAEYVDEKEHCQAKINYAQYLCDLRKFDEAMSWLSKGECADLKSTILETKGAILLTTGRFEEAIPVLREGIEVANEVQLSNPGDLVNRSHLVAIRLRLSSALGGVGELEEALKEAKQALRDVELLYWFDPFDSNVVRFRSWALSSCIGFLAEMGRFEESVPFAEKLVECTEEWAEKYPNELDSLGELANAHLKAGQIKFMLKLIDDAEVEADSALSVLARINQEQPNDFNILSRYRSALVLKDQILMERNDDDQSLTIRKKLLEVNSNVFNAAPDTVYAFRDYVSSFMFLAEAYVKVGEKKRAIEMIQEVENLMPEYEESESDEIVLRDYRQNVIELKQAIENMPNGE